MIVTSGNREVTSGRFSIKKAIRSESPKKLSMMFSGLFRGRFVGNGSVGFEIH
jgi:hypothetical protein